MARPTAEQRREDYLAIGAELVAEFDRRRAAEAPVDALAHVRLADVARRAGVTKGALYHIWGSQEAYRQDLLAHLLDLHSHAGMRETTAELEQARPLLGNPSPSMRRLSEFAFDRLKADPTFLARISFYPYASNPEVRELLLRGRAEAVQYYEMFLAASGRRMLPGYTVEDMLVLVQSFVFGSVLRHRTSPELTGTRLLTHEGTWSVVAIGVRALMERLSEPDPDRQPSS